MWLPSVWPTASSVITQQNLGKQKYATMFRARLEPLTSAVLWSRMKANFLLRKQSYLQRHVQHLRFSRHRLEDEFYCPNFPQGLMGLRTSRAVIVSEVVFLLRMFRITLVVVYFVAKSGFGMLPADLPTAFKCLTSGWWKFHFEASDSPVSTSKQAFQALFSVTAFRALSLFRRSNSRPLSYVHWGK
jgi:hypothetical protein